jgi:uncharacterized coiled-coil DUF342 family protein
MGVIDVRLQKVDSDILGQADRVTNFADRVRERTDDLGRRIRGHDAALSRSAERYQELMQKIGELRWGRAQVIAIGGSIMVIVGSVLSAAIIRLIGLR